MNVRSLVLLATLLTPASLLATPVTYNYTGQLYGSLADTPFTATEQLTGTVTYSAPLPDNLFGDPGNLLSFSFSDGVDTFTQSNSTFFSILFATDASGNITNWQIAAELGNNDEFHSGGPASAPSDHVVAGIGGVVVAGGTWTLASDQVSATPEPSSLILLGTGLAGTLAAARRRFRR